MIKIFIEYLSKKFDNWFFGKIYPKVRQNKKKVIGGYLFFYLLSCYWILYYGGRHFEAIVQYCLLYFTMSFFSAENVINFAICVSLLEVFKMRGRTVPFRFDSPFFKYLCDYIEDHPIRLAIYLSPIAFFFLFGLYTGGDLREAVIIIFFFLFFLFNFELLRVMRRIRLDQDFPIKLWHIIFSAILIVILIKYDICVYPYINFPAFGEEYPSPWSPILSPFFLIFFVYIVAAWLSGDMCWMDEGGHDFK